MVMDWEWDEREDELHTKEKGLGWPKFIIYVPKVQNVMLELIPFYSTKKANGYGLVLG